MFRSILSHITAVSSNNVIGRNNQLPWNIPEDLKFFQEKTKGHTLIMGRKTFESLGKPLPHRVNIVVSKNKNFKNSINKKSGQVFVFSDLDSAIGYAKEKSKDPEIFIIGGGEIYRQSLSKVQKIYLTRIHQEYEGDAFYPEVPKDQFELTERLDRPGPPPFSFLTYTIKSK